MKRNLLILIAIMLAMAILIYGASRESRIPKSQTVESVTVGNIQSKTAPEFELKSLDGRTVKLSDFRGKAVVLNFWATYCSPCRVEMPWFINLYRQYKAQGLEIVGLSMDDGPQEVDEFVKEMKVNYTILVGNHSVGDAYGGVRFLPQTYFIDREGRIIDQAVGFRSKTDLEVSIKHLLASK